MTTQNAMPNICECFINHGNGDIEEIVKCKKCQRAVNSFDDLYKTLKYMNHVEEGYCICPLKNGLASNGKHATSCADARKALAKAEGKRELRQ